MELVVFNDNVSIKNIGLENVKLGNNMDSLLIEKTEAQLAFSLGSMGGRSLRSASRADEKRKLTVEAQDRLSTLTFPVESKGVANFQVLDFFCGCGGMSLGFAALPKHFEVVGGCDINPVSAKTYSSNFGVECTVEDVRNVADFDDAKLREFLAGFSKYQPEKPLVLVGCAPCQGFTSHRKKYWNSAEDKRNSLVEVFAHLALRLKPQAIIMENVPDLLAKKYWPHFRLATNLLEENGYIVRQAIYNSASFGVPQERFRAIVVAMHRDFALPEPLLLDPEKYQTVRKAIGHLPPVEAGKQHPSDRLHRSAQHREETLRTIRAVPANGGSRPRGIGPACLDKVSGFSDVYGRLYWDRPAITLTHYARNPASGRYVHPEQTRGLTMREALLLQSFPANFNVTGGFDDVFRQVGEAVPPLFSCGVAAGIAVELTSLASSSDILAGIPSVHKPLSNSFSSVIAGMKTKTDR
jgi:DNA (cytosine-5)-methyltransferase 1